MPYIAFATEAAGIVHRLVPISALCLIIIISFNIRPMPPRGASNTHTPNSGEFGGDVLHAGIIQMPYDIRAITYSCLRNFQLSEPRHDRLHHST